MMLLLACDKADGMMDNNQLNLTTMIKKLFRRLFKLKKRFISPIDRMLDQRHVETIASRSQQIEIEKYKVIHQKRDQSRHQST